MIYDVVIAGGGPGGLSAALALGRGRKRVLLTDSGPRRNAAAVHVQNFVTRDGTPPNEFRRIGRQQLEIYPRVEVRDERVDSLSGSRGEFRVRLTSSSVTARRVLLCTGMIDELPPIEGFRELWGSSIFQCPYCHGWEVQDQRWSYLASAANAAHFAPFAIKLRGWTRDVVVFTNGFEPPAEARALLESAGIRLETAAVSRLAGKDGHLEAVELESGTRVARDVLFAHPEQRQVALVGAAGVELDEDGYVRVDPMKSETSVPGIYAAGDLTTRMQSAIFAAAAGTRAATMINLDLALDLGPKGLL
ncbi:MAG: NAD(P)/FAD-dependent oxidoreductase [Myxococcota bacterium]|nr:NAD(P)/FAD-dependent oxidoreductase [Myxococcota bacterium]